MKARVRAIAELVVGLAAVAGCVACWVAARSLVAVPPITEGEPATISVVYYAPLVALAFMLLALAGVLLVVGIARLRRMRGCDKVQSL